MSAFTRANPYLDEIITILQHHLEKFHGDHDKARQNLSKAESDWIDEEIFHSMTDCRYFLSNYYAIKTEEKGFQGLYPFWDSQEILHDEFRKMERLYGKVRAIVNKARQMGASTYISGEVFHKTIFTEHINTHIVAQDANQSNFIFEMYRSALDFLPWWMRPRKRYDEAGTLIDFDEKDDVLRDLRPGLKTRIYVDNGNKPTGAGRGKTFKRAHLDEVAFWSNPSQLTKALFPTMKASDGFYVMVSTPNGRNDAWHNLWRRAEAGKVEWNPIYVPYYRREKSYSIPIPKGEKFTLTMEEMELRQQILHREKYFIKDEVLNWARQTREGFIAIDGDDKMFTQEYCLIGSTFISTSDGLVPIADLKDYKGRSTGGNAITNWIPQGEADIFRATTKLGYSIVGTFEHRVPTLDSGDINLGELEGHKVTLCPTEFGNTPRKVTWKEAFNVECSLLVDEDVARFLGYFMGDGCYHDGSVIFACDSRDQDVVEDIRRLMIKFFGNCCIRVSGTKQGGLNLSVGCVEFSKTMKRLGIWKKEKPHRRVMVPEIIFTSPKHIVREFLRSVFEADGFCAYEGNRVSLFSKGKEFLRNIQVLLLGFGITSRLVRQNKKNGKGVEYTGNALDLRAAEARRFCEEIGFIGERKRSRQRILEKKIGRPQARIEFSDEVLSVESEGRQDVYDITVANSHLFAANGILVHNSTNAEESFQTSAKTAYARGIINRLSKRTINPLWIGEISYDIEKKTPGVYLIKCEASANVVSPETENRLHVWEKPISGERYCLGVDVSLGNEGGDYSCIQVVKLTSGHQKDEQVAVWHGLIVPESLSEIVYAMGMWYNEALVAVEVNSMGMVTNSDLVRNWEYENIYRYKRMDRLKNFMTDIIGFWTDEKSKRALMSKMSKALHEDTLIIRDQWTVNEFYDFNDEYEAQGEGAHDDYLMALHIALYCGHEGEFRDNQTGGPKEPSESKANVFEVKDRFGTTVAQTNSQNEAQRIAKQFLGSFTVRTATATANVTIAGKKFKVPSDFQNSDWSPVHDGEGTARQLYEDGIEPEDITPEAIKEYEEMLEVAESDPNAWMYT